MIHETAIIHADAHIDSTVEIGPYTVVGPDVEIASGSIIGPHVVIKGPTKIGKDNRIYQFSSIGDDPQDKKYKGEETSELVIGNSNVIREYCTINRGTEHGGGITRVGDNNWIMAYVHIAHDCLVGNNNVFANNSTLAGHVVINDFVILGGFTGVHQFCRVGSYSISAISSVIVKDIPPYLMVSGNSAKPGGLNKEGLRRNNFSDERIQNIKKAYKILYRNGLLLKNAMEEISVLSESSEDVRIFFDFINASNRGIVR